MPSCLFEGGRRKRAGRGDILRGQKGICGEVKMCDLRSRERRMGGWESLPRWNWLMGKHGMAFRLNNPFYTRVVIPGSL